MHLTIRIVNDRNGSVLPVRRDVQEAQAGAEDQLRAGRIG